MFLFSRSIGLATLFFAMAAISAFADSAPATDPASSEYRHRTPALVKVLTPDAYQVMTMQELAHPGFAYIDYDLARFEGYQMDKQNHLSPEALDQFRRDFANAIPGENEPASTYANVQRPAWVSGYGGPGLNGNLGDGRSATVHQGYRVKGGGRTVRVNPLSEKSHSSGGAVLGEGLREAIRSNLLARELPFGAHRTIGVLTTGTDSTNSYAYYEPRALIASEDPLRWAHFVENTHAGELGGKYLTEDQARVKSALENLAVALPKPAGFSAVGKTEGEILRAGVLEMIDRQATQAAYAYAHKFFHGATSPSNATLDGRMLDFGTLAGFDGYPKAQILEDDGYSGETRVFKVDLLKPTHDSWAKNLKPELKASLPTLNEWESRFEKTFQRSRRQEMARLAGTIDELMPDLAKTKSLNSLGETLLNIAQAGNENIIWISSDREKAYGTGTYSVEKILNVLSHGNPATPEALNASIKELLPEDQLRAKLVDAYSKTFQAQRRLAAAQGITPAAESLFRQQAAINRNKPMPALFINHTNDDIGQVVQDYAKDRDPAKTQRYVAEAVASNQREFRDAPAFSIVKSESRLADGSRVRTLFDARLGREVISTEWPAHFIGRRHPLPASACGPDFEQL